MPQLESNIKVSSRLTSSNQSSKELPRGKRKNISQVRLINRPLKKEELSGFSVKKDR